ncbi:hypothetical protein Q1695_011456 [Nippostrongylus brasiliensis]|nr:hypothetical protein Q1695_011456 [Nippostrongylus brasiliensis]
MKYTIRSLQRRNLDCEFPQFVVTTPMRLLHLPLEQKPSQGIPTSEDTIITADTDTEVLEDIMEVASDMATDMEASGDTMEADSDTDMDTDTDTDTEASEVTAISDDTDKNPQESLFLQLSCI